MNRSFELFKKKLSEKRKKNCVSRTTLDTKNFKLCKVKIFF